RKKLRADELGLKSNEVNENLISLGSKYLIPKEEISTLTALRSKAYSTIENESIDIGVGKLIPNDKIEEVRAKLEMIKSQFDEHLEHLRSEYPRMRSEMMVLWNEEALTISRNRDNPDLAFKIMSNIENAFPEKWNDVASKFGFTFWESNKLDDVAKQFVELAVSKVAQQISEFCTSLQGKIKDSGLNGNSLNAVHSWIAAFRDSVGVFESELLKDVLDTLEDQVRDPSTIKPDSFKKAMSELANVVDEGIKEIQAESVARLTSQKVRNIEM
nr:DUF3150 domain-containing protein [Candidatus Sigynarchaeota archaeon]